MTNFEGKNIIYNREMCQPTIPRPWSIYFKLTMLSQDEGISDFGRIDDNMWETGVSGRKDECFFQF